MDGIDTTTDIGVTAEVAAALLTACSSVPVDDGEESADELPPCGALPPDLRLIGEGRFATPVDAQRHVARLDRTAKMLERAGDRLLRVESPVDFDKAVRVLTVLGRMGMKPGNATVDRLVSSLRDRQLPGGSWIERSKATSIRATSRAIIAMTAVGVGTDCEDRDLEAAVQRLLAEEISADDPQAQERTAWMIRGLIAADRAEHRLAIEGIERLVRRPREEGSWDGSETITLATLAEWLVAVDSIVKRQVPRLRVIS